MQGVEELFDPADVADLDVRFAAVAAAVTAHAAATAEDLARRRIPVVALAVAPTWVTIDFSDGTVIHAFGVDPALAHALGSMGHADPILTAVDWVSAQPRLWFRSAAGEVLLRAERLLTR